MEDQYADVFSWALHNVVREFREKYPGYEGLNGQQMRGVLHGDLVIVPIRYTKKYQLWKKEDILAGKLDALNATIKNFNARVRRLNRERAEAFRHAFDGVRGEIDTSLIVDCLNKIAGA